jgi:two-component system phosphate regulon response regulator PhoB
MPTVLIADDEPAILELVRFTLEGEGVRVLEAADGQQAMALALAERPDLVLLDLRMPGLDGVEVCRRLRAEPALGRSRIVMLTAASQRADRARARAAGADDYLTKPFSPLALFALVRGLGPEAVSWRET